MPEQPIISVKNLTKSFPGKNAAKPVKALENITFDIRRGELTALIGPDGAGKTTLLRILCGLLKPDQGQVCVLGFDVLANPQEVQSKISYMPQRFGLYEDLTIEENIDLYANMHAVPLKMRPARFEKLLKMVGLEKFTSRLAGKLSGGMKQKLGLICTLVSQPELLILDEPTVGVDPLSRKELWEIFKQLAKEENITVLVSTAYLDEADLCQKVILLYESRILALSSPEKIKSQANNLTFTILPDARYPARLLQALLLSQQNQIIDAVPAGNLVRFVLNPESSLQDLKDCFSLSEAKPISPSLEDGFMFLLKKQAKNPIPCFPFTKLKISTHQTAVVKVKNLVRKFGDFVAVDNTSFTVRKGEIFGLLGPNGAGKTTTFRMLCGLLPPTSGYLSVAGVDLGKSSARARAKIGYVAQKFSLYGNLTIEENLNFFGGVYGLPPAEIAGRIQELKKEFQLIGYENVATAGLPRGFKQRLAMAAALLHKPEILFLDEPTSGIDPLARRNFWQHITYLAAQGTTIIVTTHFMEEAEYCDRIMIQDAGEVLALGTPAEVRSFAGSSVQTMNEAFIKIVEKSRLEQEPAS